MTISRLGVGVCLALAVVTVVAIESDLLALLLFGDRPLRMPRPLYTARGVLLPWGEFMPYPREFIPWMRRGPIHPRFFRDRPDPPDSPSPRPRGGRGRGGRRRGGDDGEEGRRRRRRQRNQAKKQAAQKKAAVAKTGAPVKTPVPVKSSAPVKTGAPAKAA